METEDPKYPIYRVGVHWIEDKVAEQLPWWPSDPGEGRAWDSTSFSRMYKEDPGAEEVERWAREEWWPTYAAERQHPIHDPPTIKIESVRHETWNLTWFQHETFDIGQTDAEALASFERYVRRYEDMQDFYPGEMPEGYLCLMGAEDRWRWRAISDPDEYAPAPCRCEHCKKQGKIRIAH